MTSLSLNAVPCLPSAGRNQRLFERTFPFMGTGSNQHRLDPDSTEVVEAQWHNSCSRNLEPKEADERCIIMMKHTVSRYSNVSSFTVGKFPQTAKNSPVPGYWKIPQASSSPLHETSDSWVMKMTSCVSLAGWTVDLKGSTRYRHRDNPVQNAWITVHSMEHDPAVVSSVTLIPRDISWHVTCDKSSIARLRSFRMTS
jgi:hypothetical protein